MWKKIPGFSGRYEISASGIVRNSKTKRPLKPQVNNNLYLRIQLTKNGKPANYLVHVLVAKTYLPGDGEEINHINNNRQDNRVKNLEWVSHSANIKQVWDTGGFRKRRIRSRRKLVMEETRKRVRHVMIERGWDTDKLAEIIGSSRIFASQKLNGCSNASFTLTNLIAISKASGFSLDYLCGLADK